MEAIEVAGLVVHTGTVSHPLLGRAHVIEHAGRPITAVSEIDWDRPAEIPTIAEPRALPPGSGTLLMNEIALRAQRAGVQTLRYAGPYPTHALFTTLARSFRTHGSVEEFTANVLDRSVRLARDEVAVDFTPAPFVRTQTPYGFVDRRDGAVDRVQLEGVVFDREEQAGSLARLVERRAVLTVGVPIAHVAYLGPDDTLLDGPNPIPPFTSPLNGSEFPGELREVIADSAVAYVPGPLADDVRKHIESARVIWDDLGWRASKRTDQGLSLHIGFLALQRRDMALFAQQLSYHLAMTAQKAVLEELLASRRR